MWKHRNIPCVPFEDRELVYTSHLGLNEMETNNSKMKESNYVTLPFLSCPSPWENIHFDIPYVEDLDDSQFEQKFLDNQYAIGTASEKMTTTEARSIHTNMVDCDVLEPLETLPADWHFKTQALRLSAKGLQISPVEPWNDLIVKESHPHNIIYEELDQLKNIPPSLPVDDPLRSSLPPLVPSTFSEITKSTIHCSVPLELSNLCLKELIFPDTPSCESFLDFYKYIQESTLSNAKSSLENANPLVDYKLKKSKKFDSPEITEVKACSKTDYDNLFQKMDEVKLACVTEMMISSKNPASDVITVDLPRFSLDIMNLLESYLLDCWKSVIQLNLPPLVFDLLKNNKSITDLQPSVTRLCLVKVKEEITKIVKDFPQLNCKKQAKAMLESSLPTILSLHGVNKAIDIFLNVDFNYAFKSLSDFLQTHEQVLKTSDFESFLHRLSPLIPNDSEIIHPKLIELRKQVWQHLEEKGIKDSKVWIRLLRHSDVIAPRIHSILTAAGIDCMVDPRIWRCTNPQIFHGQQTVIIAEKIASDFPHNLLSLVINYERPSIVIPHLATVPQLTLDVHRPVFDGDSNETQEIEEIPVNSLTSSCTSSSPQSYNSSPNLKDPVDPLEAEEGETEREQITIPDAEGLQSPIQKNLNVEITVHSNADSKPADIASDPVNSSTKQSLISEPIETQIDLNSAALDCSSLGEATALPISFDNTSLKTNDILPTPGIDSTTSSVNSEPIETHRTTTHVLSIICTSRLKQNVELMNAITTKDIQVHEFDYSFLGSVSIYQPDVLISAQTAVLIVSVNDPNVVKEVRMKVLLTSFKCTKCWIIVMAPDMITTSNIPNVWHSLYGLSRFYDKKEHKELGIPFQLKLHLALDYNQVARIMRDLLLDEMDGTVGDIYTDLQPTCHEAKLILHFHQFNVVTAQLIAEHVTAAELLNLDEKTLVSRIPLLKLRKKVQMFRAAIELKTEQLSDVTESLYGQLNSYLGDDSKEMLAMIQLPSPKRARFDGENENQLLKLDQVEELIEMWF